MFRSRKNIASLLLCCFLIGALVAPALHQLHHGIGVLLGEHHGDDGHFHPDYNSISDNSPHLDDNELTCVLCSFSLFGDSGDTLHSSIPDTPVVVPGWDDGLRIVHGLVSPIRGPPIYC